MPEPTELQEIVQEETERTLGAMHLRIIVLEAEKAALTRALTALAGEPGVSEGPVATPV
jgi:hypothetical protein